MRAITNGREKRKIQLAIVIDGRKYNVSESMKNVGTITAVKT